MTSLSRDRIYVAELKVLSYFRPSREIRCEISNPGGLEISKGYWVLRPPDEQSTANGYADLSLIVEFVSANLRNAEDHALKVGRTFCFIASAYGGYPLESPHLHRVASIGANGGLTSQHNYCYRPKPYMLSDFDQTVEHQFQNYLHSLSSIDGDTKHRLQSAIHWYVISISADDPTVSYVAAWTGLECIGTVINSREHPNAPKAHCQTCGNTAGDKRDDKMAGIDHMFNRLANEPLSAALSEEARELLAKELLTGLSPEEARNLRNSIVHGVERDIEALTQRSSISRRHLLHVLNASIQSVMDPNVKSWIPGDYGSHPDVRYSLKFKGELNKSPYHGEWAAELHSKTQLSTQAQERPYIGVLEVEQAIDGSAVGLVEFRSEGSFERYVDVYDLSDQSKLTGLPTWHDRPAEPRWEEFSSPECSERQPDGGHER